MATVIVDYLQLSLLLLKAWDQRPAWAPLFLDFSKELGKPIKPALPLRDTIFLVDLFYKIVVITSMLSRLPAQARHHLH